MQKHLSLFCLVGIDFLFLDFTNLVMDKDELRLLLRLTGNMRRNGYDPPRLVPFFQHESRPETGGVFYTEFYRDTAYRDAWFVLDGKPLVLSPVQHPSDRKINDAFTWRRMWAGKDADGFWHYFDDYPQTPALRPDGVAEQIAVAAGKEPRYGTTRPTVRKVPRGTARPHTTATGTAHAPAKACFSKSSGKGPNVSVR